MSNSIFTTEVKKEDTSAGALLSRLMDASKSLGLNPMLVAKEYYAVAKGSGGISPEDFLQLRLFDREFNAGADLREFLGVKQFRNIWLTVNYRSDWLGMLSNKVASNSFLAAFGLPTAATKALYFASDPKALEEFLLQPEQYPLFGKPIDSQNSLGALALASVDAGSGEVKTKSGARLKVCDIAESIESQYPNNYLFQELLEPHAQIAKLTGGRLATVRFLTMFGEHGPEIFRACWKIPAGAHAADNYWLKGNLLAGLNKDTGAVLRATSGKGVETKAHETHPDTGERLVGFVHPQWQEMCDTALKGARVMEKIPLIGWDIACTPSGPVIVEMNEWPDLFLMQFAERRGMLTSEFNRFVEYQRGRKEEFLQKIQQELQ